MDRIQTLALYCLWAIPAWAILRGAWLLTRRGRIRPWRETVMAAFAILMMGVLGMALRGAWDTPARMLQAAAERIRTDDRLNLLPLESIRLQLAHKYKSEFVIQTLGNTLLFMPWGFCLPLLWPRFRRIGRMALMALGLTLFIECTQLFIDRYVETDDVLLNFLGSMAGTGLWWCVHRRFPRLDKHLLNAT